MAKSTNGWSSLSKEITKEIAVEVKKQRDILANITVEKVIEYSPVARGTFVVNNIVSVGNPDFTADEGKTVVGSSGLSQELVGDIGASVLVKGEALSDAKRKLASAKNPYSAIYIQNNVSYVDEVEVSGWYYTDAYEPYSKAYDYLRGVINT